MKKVTAKRVGDSTYEYKGFEIRKVVDHWNIRELSTWEVDDAANTFSEAKAMIDRWEETRV